MIDPNKDLIVYVDQNGVPTGETAPKLEAHTLHTRLHLAFSCYIFNEKKQLLVTRRALAKKVWPGVWTNSVCGHPAPGESVKDAVVRRARYELGLEIKDLRVVLPTYSYKTPPFNGIVENEFCPVYFAVADGDLKPNPEEVEDYKWISWPEFLNEIKQDPETWSYWCKDQAPQLSYT